MGKKIYLIIVIIIVLISAGGYFFYNQPDTPAPSKEQACPEGQEQCEPEEEKETETETETEFNFTEEGHLIKYGEQENWGLNYEEPGKPALVVTFEFNEDSVCDLAEGKKPCSEYEDDYGEVGDRIKVIGNKEEKVVEIHKLIYVE